jgi:hypothetical protein
VNLEFNAYRENKDLIRDFKRLSSWDKKFIFISIEARLANIDALLKHETLLNDPTYTFGSPHDLESYSNELKQKEQEKLKEELSDLKKLFRSKNVWVKEVDHDFWKCPPSLDNLKKEQATRLRELRETKRQNIDDRIKEITKLLNDTTWWDAYAHRVIMLKKQQYYGLVLRIISPMLDHI